MGANQYTPSTEAVRDHWENVGFAGTGEEFDRWLATVKAEALLEAAAYAVEWVGMDAGGQLVDLKTQTEYDDTADYLRARAEQIKATP